MIHIRSNRSMMTTVLPRIRGWATMTDEGSHDRRLLDCVTHALEQTGHHPLQQLALHCEMDLVTLIGQVPTYYLKQLAQVTVLSVPGVMQVDNQLQVADGHALRPENWSNPFDWIDD